MTAGVSLSRSCGGLLLAALLLLAACASTPQASPERDGEAKQFLSHPGYAAIYVYRSDLSAEDISGSHPVLWIDDRLIGSTLPRAYFRVDTRPGKHVLRGEAPDLGQLALETSAGEVYFVSHNVHGGMSNFARVAPELGKEELRRCCILLENWAPGQRPLLR